MHDEDQDNAEFLKQEFKRNIFQDIRSRCLCCANDDDDVTSRSGRDRCFQRDRTADRDESKCISFDALRFTIIDNQMFFVKLVHTSTLLLLFILLLAANFDAVKRTAPKKKRREERESGSFNWRFIAGARMCQ